MSVADLVAVSGGGLIIAGVELAHGWPAALIIAGALLIAAAWKAADRR